MNLKDRIVKYLFIALILRIVVLLFSSNNILFDNPEHHIGKVFQRSAYLMFLGEGYSQTIPDSKSYNDLQTWISELKENNGAKLIQLSGDGLYPTAHYPPGFSVLEFLFFCILKIPISQFIGIFGILIDLLTLITLNKLLKELNINDSWAKICLLIYAIAPPLIYASVFQTPDSLISLFIMFIFLCLLKFDKENKIKYILLIGLINGICAYFRSDYFLLPGFVLLYFLIQKLSIINIYNYIKFNLFVYSVSIIILLPWGIRNYLTFNKFSISSSALGGTLVSGLAAFSNPWHLLPSDLDRKAEAISAGIETPFEFNGDQYFKTKFATYLNENPVYYLKSIGLRTLFFLVSPQPWGLKKYDTGMKFSNLKNQTNYFGNIKSLFFNYWSQLISVLFSVLAWFGYFVYWRDKNRNLILFYISGLIFLCCYISHIWIHIAPNYTLPIFFLQIFFFSYLISKNRYSIEKGIVSMLK
jgi:hypothetical protein